MAHLYPHKKLGWQVLYTICLLDGSTKRKWRYFRNKLRAQAVMQDIEKLEYRSLHRTLTQEDLRYFYNRKLISNEESVQLSGICVQSPTLQELADEYKKRSEIECRSMVHKINMIRVQHLLVYFGDKLSVNEITLSQIEGYRGYRLKLISATTVNKEIIKLAQLLDIAVNKAAIAVNPARQIKRLKDLKERKPRALTRDEIAALLKMAMAKSQWLHGMLYEIVCTYLYTGMRRGELLNLRWEDVDLERRRITIQAAPRGGTFNPKSGTARIVGLANNLLTIACKLPRNSPFVFGDQLTPDGVTHMFKKLVREAGLPKSITLHSLRHTYITHMLEVGVPLRRVMERVGHKELETILRYSHVLPSEGVDEDRLDF